MIHLLSPNPALDLFFDLKESHYGKTGQVLEAQVTPGGKALNVARFLKRSKINCSIWLGTGGGNDPTHVLYRSLLAREKLKVSFLSGKSPIRFNVVTRLHHQSSKYNHSGFITHFDNWKVLCSRVKPHDLLVLTGSLPPGVPDTLYRSWIKTFKNAGVLTVVDASGKALYHALQAQPWFFKANLFEISKAVGKRIENLKQAMGLVKTHPFKNLSHGALTNGKFGAIVWKNKEYYRVIPPRIVSPLVVGAGDAFLAGYLRAHQLGRNLRDSAILAGAYGASVASVGIERLTSKEVSQWTDRIKVQRIS